ncbi:MAG: esterase family protein [Lachnospiraceae bacterium]|nr:esterase family protein [Lachnospiraceae bacterium]
MTKNEICILLPSGVRAETGKKYPVLWLLHGATCDYDDFLQKEHVPEMLRGHEVMVVMPSGLNSDFANHMEFGGGFAYTDFLMDELMPYIYSYFPASDDPEDNFLAGFSMGGAAALMLALYRPECFGRVAVLGSTVRESEFLQPYLDWTGEEFRAAATADPTRFPTEFGNPERGITRKEINMIARYQTVRDYVDSMECTWERFAERAGEGRVPSMLFCCGDQDGCCEKVKEFRKSADNMGVNTISYEYIPGYGHDRADVTIQKAIEWFGI